MSESKFAPREVFEQILEWSVLPTFDLVLVYGNQGIIQVRRTIEPYKNVWALPGLRMYKGEMIDDTLRRIAMSELGLKLDTSGKVLLAQYVGKFQTEFGRQDISTAYVLSLRGDEVLKPNPDHFSDMKINFEASSSTGAMYKYYIKQFHIAKK